MLWLEPNGFVIIADGFVVLIQTVVGVAPVIIEDCVFWLEPNGFVIIADGFVVLIQPVIGVAPAVVSLGVIRFEADAFSTIADGFVVLVQPDIGAAPVIVRQGVVRFEAELRYNLRWLLDSLPFELPRQPSQKKSSPTGRFLQELELRSVLSLASDSESQAPMEWLESQFFVISFQNL